MRPPNFGISSAIYIPEIALALGSAGQRCPALPSGAAQRWAALALPSIFNRRAAVYCPAPLALLSASAAQLPTATSCRCPALLSAAQRCPAPLALPSATAMQCLIRVLVVVPVRKVETTYNINKGFSQYNIIGIGSF